MSFEACQATLNGGNRRGRDEITSLFSLHLCISGQQQRWSRLIVLRCAKADINDVLGLQAYLPKL